LRYNQADLDQAEADWEEDQPVRSHREANAVHVPTHTEANGVIFVSSDEDEKGQRAGSKQVIEISNDESDDESVVLETQPPSPQHLAVAGAAAAARVCWPPALRAGAAPLHFTSKQAPVVNQLEKEDVAYNGDEESDGDSQLTTEYVEPPPKSARMSVGRIESPPLGAGAAEPHALGAGEAPEAKQVAVGDKRKQPEQPERVMLVMQVLQKNRTTGELELHYCMPCTHAYRLVPPNGPDNAVAVYGRSNAKWPLPSHLLMWVSTELFNALKKPRTNKVVNNAQGQNAQTLLEHGSTTGVVLPAGAV
jgi:hypothetical protein